MDNFDDFSASPKSSSKLASIFGQDKNQQSNASLTYTAPKQPKKEASPKQIAHEPSSPKLELIIAKTVFAYKLINSAYQSLGKMGFTIVGCISPPIYQLLMYKSKDDVICRIKLNANTSFTLLEDNYTTFYVDSQNYSVKFENSDDLKAFIKKFVEIKSYLSPQDEIISQDVKFGNGNAVAQGTAVNVKTTCFQLSESQSETFICSDIIEATIGEKNAYSWIDALDGMRYKGEKVLIIPKNLSESWVDKLANGTKLLLHIELIELVIQSLTEEKHEARVDSSFDSAEDSSSIKEKSALLEDALASKSLKSGLLSRVARLGQPMLPLKGAIVADLTDSEDDSSPSPKPRVRAKPPNVTARTSHSIKVPMTNEAQRDIPQSLPQPVPQSVALYQPPYQSQIIVRNDGNTFSALPATTATCLVSPSDPSLPVYFAESRTQATELRMGLSKLNDKVDLVLNKLQDSSNLGMKQANMSPVLDPSGLLSSIQNLVSENHTLKDKVEEQKNKIDTQNERIYNLLELSHRSLEQNTATLKTQAIDDKQLIDKTVQIEKEFEEAQSLISVLNSQLSASQKNEAEFIKKLDIIESQSNDLYKYKEKSDQLEAQLQELHKKTSENLLQQNNTEIQIITDENILLKKEAQKLNNELELIKIQVAKLKSDNLNNLKIKEELIDSKGLIEKLKYENENIMKLKSEIDSRQLKLEELSKNDRTSILEVELNDARLQIDELLEIKELNEKERIDFLCKFDELAKDKEKSKANLNTNNGEEKLKAANLKIEKLLEADKLKDKDTLDEKNKLFYQIQKLTDENTEIKANLNKNSNSSSMGDISSTKVLMNNVFRNLHTQFEMNEKYTGETIKQILASSIRDMTLQFLEKYDSKDTSKESQPESSVEEKETTSKEILEASPSSENVAKGTFYNVDSNSSSRSLPHSPDSKSEKSSSSTSFASPDKSITTGAKNIDDCLDIQVAKDKKAAYSQMWQTSEPPPLPAFDEEDDDPW